MKRTALVISVVIAAALGAGTATAQTTMLMVDDIDAANQSAYTTALTNAGEPYTLWDLDVASFPTLTELTPYTILIWADESTLSPGDTECQIVVDWLNLGGKRLFATSVDFLWDLENGSVGNGEHNLYLMFLTEYLGDFAGTGITSLDGVAADPIGGSWSGSPMALPGISDNSGDYCDIALSTATTGLIYGAGGSGTGNGAATHYYDPVTDYATVWLGVNFHNGISLQSDRDTLMSNIITFFETVPVELQSFTID
jgi:hypothetical protein